MYAVHEIPQKKHFALIAWYKMLYTECFTFQDKATWRLADLAEATGMPPETLRKRMVLPYRSTSLKRTRTPLGPYRRPMPRVLGGS